jgi:hypothetical protein
MRLWKPENDNLNRLLQLSNQSLAMFGQPPLYAEAAAKDHVHGHEQKQYGRASMVSNRPKYELPDCSDCFHISLAWSLSGPSETDIQILHELDTKSLKDMLITFDSVKAKIGSKKYIELI